MPATTRNFAFICGPDDFIVGRLGKERFEALATEANADEFSREIVSGFAVNVDEDIGAMKDWSYMDVYKDDNAFYRKVDWRTVPMVLITSHRRENIGDGIAQICEAIAALSRLGTNEFAAEAAKLATA